MKNADFAIVVDIPTKFAEVQQQQQDPPPSKVGIITAATGTYIQYSRNLLTNRTKSLLLPEDEVYYFLLTDAKRENVVIPPNLNDRLVSSCRIICMNSFFFE
jgi:hypothetical protein